MFIHNNDIKFDNNVQILVSVNKDMYRWTLLMSLNLYFKREGEPIDMVFLFWCKQAQWIWGNTSYRLNCLVPKIFLGVGY
jgi:hypothetical protein